MSTLTSTNNQELGESPNMSQSTWNVISNTLPASISSQYYFCSVAVRTAVSQYNVNFLVMANGLPNDCHNDSATGYSQVISKCAMSWYKAYGTKNYGCYCTVGINAEGHEFLFEKASPISEDLAQQILEIGTKQRFDGDSENSCMKMYELNDAKNSFVQQR